MTEPPAHIDIRKLDPNRPTDRVYVSSLLVHLNQIDARVQTTTANTTIWHETLNGLRFGAVVETAHGYYRDYNPKSPDRDALTISTLGHLIREKRRYLERKGEAQRPLERRKGGRMPRHVLEKFQANGYLTTRDPGDYT